MPCKDKKDTTDKHTIDTYYETELGIQKKMASTVGFAGQRRDLHSTQTSVRSVGE